MKFVHFVAISFVMSIVAGCGPSPSSRPQSQSAGEYMADWRQLAEKPVEEFDANSATIIAGKLFAIDGNHDRLLGVLADPDEPPEAKVFVVQSLRPYLNATLEPRLAELTGQKFSRSTRVTATQLLGFLNTDFALKRLRELLDDPEHTVRGQALVSLLEAEQDGVFEYAEKAWHDELTKPEHKTQLILTLPLNYALGHTEDYAEAATDLRIGSDGRIRALDVLYRTGDVRWVALMRQVAESDPDARVRDMAKQVADLLQPSVPAADAAVGETAAPDAESAPGSAAETRPETQIPAEVDSLDKLLEKGATAPLPEAEEAPQEGGAN